MAMLEVEIIMFLIGLLFSALFGILQANPISDSRIAVQVTPKNISVPYGGTATLQCNTNSNYNQYEHPAIIWQCYRTGLSNLGVSSIDCSGNVHREGKSFGDCSVFSKSVSSCELKVELIRKDFTCKCILNKEVELARVYMYVYIDSLKSDSLNATTSSPTQTNKQEEIQETHDNIENKRNLVNLRVGFIVITVITVIVLIGVCIIIYYIVSVNDGIKSLYKIVDSQTPDYISLVNNDSVDSTGQHFLWNWIRACCGNKVNNSSSQKPSSSDSAGTVPLMTEQGSNGATKTVVIRSSMVSTRMPDGAESLTINSEAYDNIQELCRYS